MPDEHATERSDRLAAGLDERASRRRARPELLAILGGALVPSGIIAIVLGWRGAARTGYDFEQTPYLLSGGALGLALVIVGSCAFFAYWLTVLIAEGRRQDERRTAEHEELMAALSRLDASPGDVEAVSELTRRASRRRRA